MGRIFKDWRSGSVSAWLWESSGVRETIEEMRDHCRRPTLEKTEEWGSTCAWRAWLS